MELQEILLALFNSKLERSNCFFSWHISDLKGFSDNELYKLNSTCNYFNYSNPKVAKLVQERIGGELFRRSRPPKFKPKIRKKRGKRVKNKQGDRQVLKEKGTSVREGHSQ